MAVNPWSLSRSSVQFAHRWYLPCSSQTTTKFIVPKIIFWEDLMLADQLSLNILSLNVKLPPFEVRRRDLPHCSDILNCSGTLRFLSWAWDPPPLTQKYFLSRNFWAAQKFLLRIIFRAPLSSSLSIEADPWSDVELKRADCHIEVDEAAGLKMLQVQ